MFADFIGFHIYHVAAVFVQNHAFFPYCMIQSRLVGNGNIFRCEIGGFSDWICVNSLLCLVIYVEPPYLFVCLSTGVSAEQYVWHCAVNNTIKLVTLLLGATIIAIVYTFPPRNHTTNTVQLVQDYEYTKAAAANCSASMAIAWLHWLTRTRVSILQSIYDTDNTLRLDNTLTSMW